MAMKNPILATCPKCGKYNVMICSACGLCGVCNNHTHCFLDNSNGYTPDSFVHEMVQIEGGNFQMGSEDGKINEKPVHSVTVSSFFIGRYPVTQKEWMVIMESNPSHFKGDNKPIENVSWYEAVEFCNKLSEKEGFIPVYAINGTNVSCNWQANGYRLPTEAEWEYAARGGNQSKGYTYSGSKNLNEVGWYNNNSDSETKNIGFKSPNQLGVYDMSGNVAEWCWDWYEEYNCSSLNPHGASEGHCRVIRGGNYSSYDFYCRITRRSSSSPNNRSDVIGIRLAMTL